MKSMRKVICIIGILSLLLTAGCGRSSAPAASAAPEAAPAETQAPAPEPAAAEEAAEAAVEAAVPEPAPESAPEPSAEPEPALPYDTAAYEAALNALLDEYRLVRITEPGEYREEEHPEIPWYSIVTYLYYQYDGVDLCYGRYDFDGNGVPELVMATRSEESLQPIGIYAFDGSKFVYLCKEQPLGERTSVSVSSDGTFTVSGSGGAASGVVQVYRIAADGYSVDTLDWYDYEYQDDGSIVITPHIGLMDAEQFNPEDIWQPFDVPIEYTVLP